MMLLWASANRDPREFPDPGVLDLEWPNHHAHLAFGHGLHHCLGAALARLEVRFVTEEFLSGCAQMKLAEGRLHYLPSVFVRALESLPFEVT